MALAGSNTAQGQRKLTRRQFGVVVTGAATLALVGEATAQTSEPTADAPAVLPPFALPGVVVLGDVCIDCDGFFAVDDAQP
jgi:hypothetical protein